MMAALAINESILKAKHVTTIENLNENSHYQLQSV